MSWATIGVLLYAAFLFVFCHLWKNFWDQEHDAMERIRAERNR